jgi:apolipoprotein N-acyltransferase
LSRPGRPEALAAASGVLLALSFPKFGHGLVAWIALVPLLVALASAAGRAHGFRLGYITGAVSSVGIVYWTSLVVVQYGGLSTPVGIVVMGLLCLALALFPSLFGWMVAGWCRAFGADGLLLAPVAWVATEILRAHTLFNFAWCLLGYSQHDFPAVIQVARFGAVYAVSFVVAVASSVLAYAVVEARARRRWSAAAGGAALVATALAYGAWTLGRTPEVAGMVKVGLVQASIPQDEKWDAEHAYRNLAAHVELTRAASGAGARLVVWPESSLPFLFDRTPAVADELRRLTRERGIHLLFGNDDRDIPEDGRRRRIWVGAKMLAPDGALTLRYHKMRLVPFGEYVPLESVITFGGRFTARLVQAVGEFTPGTEYAVAPVDGHLVGASICYEAIFPDHAREFARGGAGLLANVTNDAWYGFTSAPYQHFAMAKFRAVENGRYLVRAANTGISAVVDDRGRVVEATRLFERTFLVRDVPIVRGTTFYTRFGDLFAWASLGGAVALTAVALVRTRRG